MTSKANTLYRGQWSAHRSFTGSPVAAEANNLGLKATIFGGDYESLWVSVDLTAGTTPKVTIDVMAYDSGTATWRSIGTITDLVSGKAVEVNNAFMSVVLKLTAVTGSPTGVVIRVAGGKRSY